MTLLVADVPDAEHEAGDMVKVKGLDGSWRFKARRQHLETGNEWADVYGGPDGKEHRSVMPDRVTKIRKKRLDKASA